MDGAEYNDMVRFLENKDDKHRTWPRRVEESKDIRRQKGHIARNAKTLLIATHDGLLFKTNEARD